MRDHLYKSPIILREHTDDSGSFFRALGFTSPVEQLALRATPAESLLTWLTKPTSPHLVEAVSTSESHMALAILVTPEALYDPYSPRVGLGLVYKAPYIKTASFSEAFFYLKSASEAEADKRITDSCLMFVQINEASKVIPLPTPVLGDCEVTELVRDPLDQMYALCLKTLQEMGFIREVDRALAKSIMSEFIRLQLIVGEDLNSSLGAMHADLEVTTDELIRDLDIAAQNSTDLPSENPSVRVALHRFRELVKLKLTLPLAQVDVACEDMDRFLHHRLEELPSLADMRNLIESLSQRVAAHQSRMCQIVYSEPLKHVEVALWVFIGMAADQPLESNFFPGISEGLLGRLGIAAPGEKNPPTSSREGAAQLWASAVMDSVQATEQRQVRLETSGPSWMPTGLHLNYEEDFLNCQSHQVSGVFTDPLFLPNMVNSV